MDMLQGILPIQRSRIAGDVIAGLTLAALAIPEVMGYTKISGTPVITGLYTILIPMALFALFGSSRHLVVGADSATAAILAAGITGLAATGSDEYTALAAVLALMCAVLLAIARLAGLGFLADFLSRSVLLGFLTGVGVQVALGELPGMLGIEAGGHGTVGKLVAAASALDRIDAHECLLAGTVLVVVLGCKRISRRLPGALIAVVGATIASWGLDLGSRGVQVLGEVPSGLPHLALPAVDWSFALVARLLPIAFAMFIVILAQSAATSRAYAARYDERFHEDRDLVGLALANLGAGLSGTFMVAGSPTKTQMVDSAGGRSQLAHLTTCALVLLVLLFFTGPLAFLPSAVLSAVVFVIGLDLLHIEGLRRVYRERRGEFWVALLTLLTVVLVGVEQGILLALALSLIEHTRRGYHPHNCVLVRTDAGDWQASPVTEARQMQAGLLVYRFSHSMYYANAGLLEEQVSALAKAADPPLRWICLEASAVDDIDFSAAETLRSLRAMLQERGIRLVFLHLTADVQARLGDELDAIAPPESRFASPTRMLEAFSRGP